MPKILLVSSSPPKAGDLREKCPSFNKYSLYTLVIYDMALPLGYRQINAILSNSARGEVSVGEDRVLERGIPGDVQVGTSCLDSFEVRCIHLRTG